MKINDKMYYTFMCIILFSFIYHSFDKKIHFTDSATHLNTPHLSYLHQSVNSYLSSLYYSITTQTTMGFGDILANSLITRVITSIQSLITFYIILS